MSDPIGIEQLDPAWRTLLAAEFTKPYMQELADFLEQRESVGKTLLPAKPLRFNAFNSCALDDIKVVILGQDPYPTIGHAHGLCFSVLPEVKPLPKSLLNINKELFDDLAIDNSHCGYLQPWAEQGVFLLNTILTVEAGQANSHQGKGWEKFTDEVIKTINQKTTHCVFILWGAYAQKKAALLDERKHLIIRSAHPSPLSAYRGFWGSKPFSQTNDYLKKCHRKPIDWQLPS